MMYLALAFGQKTDDKSHSSDAKPGQISWRASFMLRAIAVATSNGAKVSQEASQNGLLSNCLCPKRSDQSYIALESAQSSKVLW